MLIGNGEVEIERVDQRGLGPFAHNPKREQSQRANFFTPNGRNPLKMARF